MDYSFIFGLFIKGMLVGSTLTVIPFILGYTLNGLLNIIKGG